MASFDLTLIDEENPSASEAYDIDFVTGHTVGDIIEMDGTVSGGISDILMGVVVRAGDANGKKTRVLRKGAVRSSSGASFGVAANLRVYSDGDNTASDTEPAGAAGTWVTVLGQTFSTTRFLVDVHGYEKGA